MSRCKSCGAEIVWGRTTVGASMPLDAEPEKRAVVMLAGKLVPPDNPDGGTTVFVDTYTPHWATCPTADRHRRKEEG